MDMFAGMDLKQTNTKKDKEEKRVEKTDLDVKKDNADFDLF